MNGSLNRVRAIMEVIGQSSLIGVSFSILLLFLLEMHFERVYFYEPNEIILYSEITMSILVFLYSLYSFKKWVKNL